MIKVNQPGEPTYRRNKIIWVFEPELERELYIELITKIIKTININATLDNVKKHFFTIPIGKYIIYIACYEDGWHIEVVKWNGVAISKLLKEKVFGDINMNYIWTQETEKVAGIIKQLYIELKKYEENV